MDADITLENHGSIVLVRPLTPDGNRWLTDNVTSDALWFAGAVVVEPRYLESLIDGMIGDGLIVRGA